MGKIVTHNQPCLNPNCKSSDGRQIYEEGTSWCFVCSTFFKKDQDPNEPHIAPKVEVVQSKESRAAALAEVKTFKARGFQERNITKLVCEFFNVKVSYKGDGEIDKHYYPYANETGYKCRTLPKTFTWIGEPAVHSLFGKDQFNGGGKRLIITEGELDALSVAQATYLKYGKFYPVVSVSSSGAAEKTLLENRDWIRSFKEVVLCLDNDEAGEKATQKAIKIIGPDKVKVWNPGVHKDASDVFTKEGFERLNQIIWDSTSYSPAGIISKEDIWKQISERNSVPSVPYPDCMKGVNGKIKGMRPGEIALFCSGTGSGKSTLLREIMLHIIKTTKAKIGIISLEESPGETGIKLAAMAISRNPSNEEISDDDLKVGFDEVFGSDRVVVLDHQGSISDDSVLEKLEYMALLGCEYLFIDHVTILVSEGAEGKTGNEAIDLVMNHLLRLVKRHPVWVGLVSHLRKVSTGGKSFEEGRMPTMDDIRGSGSIKQISFDILAFCRNMTAADETTRNAIAMSVLKSRTIGLTGPVPGATYDHVTGRLTASEYMGTESFDDL
jgi:twinkle protein